MPLDKINSFAETSFLFGQKFLGTHRQLKENWGTIECNRLGNLRMSRDLGDHWSVVMCWHVAQVGFVEFSVALALYKCMVVIYTLNSRRTVAIFGGGFSVVRNMQWKLKFWKWPPFSEKKTLKILPVWRLQSSLYILFLKLWFGFLVFRMCF